MRCLTLNECQQWRKKHCRRDEMKRQTTCVTPIKRLPWYTAVLVGQLQPFARALLIIDYSNRLRNPRTHRTLAVAAVDDHLEATVERQLHEVSADHFHMSFLTRPDCTLFATSWRGGDDTATSSLRSRATLLLSNTNGPRQPWALPLASHAEVSAHIRGVLLPFARRGSG